MRTSPSVSVDSSGTVAWRWFQAALLALAAVALLAWMGQHLGFGEAAWVVALLGGAIAAKLGWALSGTPGARLRWTGSEWLLRLQGVTETPVAAPAVMVDLGGWMLVRVGTAGRRARWLTVSRHGAAAGWPPFRAAVYSNASGFSPRSTPERGPS
jgi:hypothetical protein